MVHTAPFFSIRIIEFSPFDFFNFMATAEQALLEYGRVDKTAPGLVRRRLVAAVIYCRNMISGSALSGTRRHCALSSASKRQTSPPFDISRSSPRSSRHMVGANAVTAGSQCGLRNTAKLSAAASVLVRVRPQIGWPLL